MSRRSKTNVYEVRRRRMVEDQLAKQGILSSSVLQAMAQVPRERFVPPDCTDLAYADQALPTSCDQTISQPYIVALMSEALQLDGDERVLEIGTGSGYQTAILALLAREVFSIERHAPLSAHAATLLDELGCRNVQLRIGDGYDGWREEAPFDRVIVTAAAEECPVELLRQLKAGGILVGPFGPAAQQVLQSIVKPSADAENQALVRLPHTGCRFVPLVRCKADEFDNDGS